MDEQRSLGCIEIENTGVVSLTSLTITDVIPAAQNPGSLTVASGTTASVADPLEPGEIVTYTITSTVPAGGYENEVQVSGTNGVSTTEMVSDTASVTIEALPDPDVAITKQIFWNSSGAEKQPTVQYIS